MKTNILEKSRINRKQNKLREIGKTLFCKAEDFNCKPLIKKLIKQALFELNSLTPKYVKAENTNLMKEQNNLKCCLERIAYVEHFFQNMPYKKAEQNSWYSAVVPWLLQTGDELSKLYLNYSGLFLEIVLPDEITKSKYPIGNSYKDLSDLTKFAQFLDIDINWMSATCALQIQEVAVTIVAKRKGIPLDKRNVTQITKNTESNEPTFAKKYEAFRTEIMNCYHIDMPIMITDFRDMRRSVLHQGYSPKEEEITSIIRFTIGLLKRLKTVEEAA
jgi:hypothetical protein